MRWIRNALVMLLLCAGGGAGHAATDGYVGTVYHAHIKRTGGRLVADEYAATGYRWDDYDLVEVTARTQRIPAVPGHGLQLIAVLYDMPPDASVDVVLLYDTLHLVTDKQALLKELHRALKPDGFLSADHQHTDRKDFLATLTTGNLFCLQAENGHVLNFRKL